jgi:uncharacterized protein YbjT (DUF2867 family)
MKIAVLGATGPTGIHLVTELRKTVATVRVIARSMDTLARLFPEAAVEKWEADIRDPNATPLAVDGCDLVYDCIGLPGDQMHLHPVIARNIAAAPPHQGALRAGVQLLGLLPTSAGQNEREPSAQRRHRGYITGARPRTHHQTNRSH